MLSLLNTLANLTQDIFSGTDKTPQPVNRTPDYINRLSAAREAADALPDHIDPSVAERLYALHEEAGTLAGIDISACMMIANEMEDLLDRAHAGEFDRVA